MAVIHLETKWSEMGLGQLYIPLFRTSVLWRHDLTTRSGQLDKLQGNKPVENKYLCLKLESKDVSVQAYRGPEGSRMLEAPGIFRQSAHEDDKVVSPTHRPPLPSRKDP